MNTFSATQHAAAANSKASLWTGRAMSAFAVLFLAFDAGFKLLAPQAAIDAGPDLGFDAGKVFALGLIQLVCLALYLIPRTAVLGAVLWTGYLGGAIATPVRVGSPLLTHTLFPIYVAILLWGGLWLRDRRARMLLGPI
jgi:hypothetical protein